jgi:molecular chaperone GrpE
MEEKDKNIINDESLLSESASEVSDTSSPDDECAAQPESTTNTQDEKSVSEENPQENQSKENKNVFGKKKKPSKKDKDKEALEQLGQKLAELNDKHMRLAAEFDNYRKRTLKEKSDLIKYGAEASLKNILPVIDDFERALKSLEKTPDDDPVKAGILLIYSKFRDYLTRQGIKEIDCSKCEFNVDEHEAITKFPAPSEELKGKIIDVLEKGYCCNDKVIRFAKVVIGE